MDSLDWIIGIEYAVAFIGNKYKTYATGTSKSSKSSKKRHDAQQAPKDSQREEREMREPTTERVKKIQDEETQVQKIKQEYEARIKELVRIKDFDHKKNSERIKELERENKDLGRQNEKLKKQLKQLENRSMEITSAMSKLTDARGNFENVNDEFNNSKLAQIFESLYSNKWVFLAGRMSKTFRSMPELERISFLTNLMKYGYNECKAAADSQLCTLWQTDKIEEVPADEDLSEFLQLRRQYAVKGSVRNNIKRVISDKLLQTEEVCVLCSGESGVDVKMKLRSFLEEYLDCCWLMSVSHPAMVLDFDVVGKHFSECTDNFKVYSTKRPVEDMSKVVGTICEVVWPCVHQKDECAIYMKGDVVLVKKGLEPKENN
ncbi:myosin-2-like isoform X2 [Mercenaria mercenaria]|uniref:myosin-2-like isoform X2 n=1 Tax=Mercenaria mercenaria TaxID=6596 RepID=UPI00234F1A84|nr:myosin-2-like isoform X2 [Mercenaria mercenaria]